MVIARGDVGLSHALWRRADVLGRDRAARVRDEARAANPVYMGRGAGPRATRRSRPPRRRRRARGSADRADGGVVVARADQRAVERQPQVALAVRQQQRSPPAPAPRPRLALARGRAPAEAAHAAAAALSTPRPLSPPSVHSSGARLRSHCSTPPRAASWRASACRGTARCTTCARADADGRGVREHAHAGRRPPTVASEKHGTSRPAAPRAGAARAAGRARAQRGGGAEEAQPGRVHQKSGDRAVW